jgi:transposase
MMIIGCDYHPGFQPIAFVDTETGELQERRLEHREEAEKFYRDLGAQGVKIRVGMEASGHAHWFERLLAELEFELWIGDATAIHAQRVRKQKTDRQLPYTGEFEVVIMIERMTEEMHGSD